MCNDLEAKNKNKKTIGIHTILKQIGLIYVNYVYYGHFINF